MFVLKQDHNGFYTYVSTPNGRKLCFIEYGDKFKINNIEGLDEYNIVKLDALGLYLYFIDDKNNFYYCELKDHQVKDKIKIIDNNVDAFTLNSNIGCHSYIYAKTNKHVYFGNGRLSGWMCITPYQVREIMIGSQYSLFLYNNDRIDYFEIPQNIHKDSFNFEEHVPVHTKYLKHSFSVHQEVTSFGNPFFIFYLFDEDKMHMLNDYNFNVETVNYNKTYIEGFNVYGNILNQYLSLVSESTIDLYRESSFCSTLSVPRNNVDCILLHDKKYYVVTVDGEIYQYFSEIKSTTFGYKIVECDSTTKQINLANYQLCK